MACVKSYLVQVILLLLFVSCGKENQLPVLEARIMYLRVKLGERTDKEGKAYFRNMSQGHADSIYNALTEDMRRLERDSHDPQKHYEAECAHAFGVCEIQSGIENDVGTIAYMLEARKKKR